MEWNGWPWSEVWSWSRHTDLAGPWSQALWYRRQRVIWLASDLKLSKCWLSYNRASIQIRGLLYLSQQTTKLLQYLVTLGKPIWLRLWSSPWCLGDITVIGLHAMVDPEKRVCWMSHFFLCLFCRVIRSLWNKSIILPVCHLRYLVVFDHKMYHQGLNNH